MSSSTVLGSRRTFWRSRRRELSSSWRSLVSSVVVVPLLVLGDPEVDERAAPEVAEPHDRGMLALIGGEDRRADPHEGRALLDGDAVVLRRSHAQLARDRARRRASRRRRKYGRDASGSLRERRHRHEPPDRRVALDEGRRSPRARRRTSTPRRRGSPRAAPGWSRGARPSPSRPSARARTARSRPSPCSTGGAR